MRGLGGGGNPSKTKDNVHNTPYKLKKRYNDPKEPNLDSNSYNFAINLRYTFAITFHSVAAILIKVSPNQRMEITPRDH